MTHHAAVKVHFHRLVRCGLAENGLPQRTDLIYWPAGDGNAAMESVADAARAIVGLGFVPYQIRNLSAASDEKCETQGLEGIEVTSLQLKPLD